MTTADESQLDQGVSRTRTYLLVLVCHAVVITALWAFGWYFSAL